MDRIIFWQLCCIFFITVCFHDLIFLKMFGILDGRGTVLDRSTAND